MTSRTGSARRIWRFWKSQLVKLSPASGEDGWLSLARRSQASGLCGGCHTCWGGQNRKNVYLSPYVEEPLNSKVIKSFVPELRSRKCFSCFEIPMFYVYIYMNIICPFRISVSGYGTHGYFKSRLKKLLTMYIYIWTLYVHFAYPYLVMVHMDILSQGLRSDLLSVSSYFTFVVTL